MACRRCSICTINFPCTNSHVLCDGCGEQTFILTNDEPDRNWQSAALKQKLAYAEAEEAVDPIPTFAGDVERHDDELFFSSYDVVSSGWNQALHEGMLFRVGNQTFEVRSYDAERREYWIRSFEANVTQEELDAFFS